MVFGSFPDVTYIIHYYIKIHLNGITVGYICEFVSADPHIPSTGLSHYSTEVIGISKCQIIESFGLLRSYYNNQRRDILYSLHLLLGGGGGGIFVLNYICALIMRVFGLLHSIMGTLGNNVIFVVGLWIWEIYILNIDLSHCFK